MSILTKPLLSGITAKRARILVGGFTACFVLGAVLMTALFQTQIWLYRQPVALEPMPEVLPFPVGVDPATRRIIEQPNVSGFFSTQIASGEESRPSSPQGLSWLKRTWNRLAQSAFVQQLASPRTRVLVIWPGERREQVVDNFGDILGWDHAERDRFAAAVLGNVEALNDGMFFPGKYIVSVNSSPEMVADEVNERFTAAILERYPHTVAAQVALSDAITIASLLEREAYDFTDMREISGIIWNRLFSNMELQIDATLQYVKGSRPYGPWWPAVRPSDKYLDSPFNTYKHAGLPPAPIGNPSPEAVLAALNPRATECLFYFHDTQGGFHCAPTYEEHVSLLRQIYGRGK